MWIKHSEEYMLFHLYSTSSNMRMKSMATAAIFFTLIFLLCYPSMVLSVTLFRKIQLPPNVAGPEALAIFQNGTTVQFYTGVADGRILKYEGPTSGFVVFGYTAPNRSKSLCDGTSPANPRPDCGRPLGMALHQATKKLYVCDAFSGFGVLGPNGGLLTQLSTSAEGEPYRFCNAVDIHQRSGNVYFTDASARFDIRQLQIAVSVKDSTGRLMKYDIKKNEVTVLSRNLSGPAGVAVDEREEYVLVSEFIRNRTIKIWLQGPKAKKFNVINSQPMPDNIKRTTLGNFWLAAARVNQQTQSLVPIGQRINALGNVLLTLNFGQWYGNTPISEVHEFAGKIYVGSRMANFISVLGLN